MVKRVKYFLIAGGIIILLSGSVWAYFCYDFTHLLHTKVPEKPAVNEPESKASNFNVNALAVLKHKIYSGLEFDRELLDSVDFFSQEDFKVLSFFSLKGIKTILQIKKDFLQIEQMMFLEENLIKDFILKNVIHVSNLKNKENMEHIFNLLFIDDYKSAIELVAFLDFVNPASNVMLHKWKKDLENYVVVDEIMKKYL